MGIKNTILKYSFTSLIVLSIICGIIWRWEIEHQGWAGLKWLSYFHYSIPISFLMFIVWANCFINTGLQKKLVINITFIVYGILIYYLIELTISYLLSGGLLDILLLISASEWKKIVYKYSVYGLILFIPISGYLILTAFRLRSSKTLLTFSVASLVGAILINPWLLKIIDHKGGHDYIHAVKSGILIPFIIFSFGLIVIGLKKYNLKSH